MFLHERGYYMSIYTWAYFGTLMIGPIISGPMSDRFGWRSFWWLNVACYAAVFVFQLFLFPECKFDRQTSQILESDSTSTSDKAVASTAAEKDVEGARKPTAREQEHVDQFLYKGKPSRWQFFEMTKLRGTKDDVINSIFIPLYLFAFPIIEWGSFVLSWSASCFLVVNLTQSQAFSAPPYNFSSTAVGLTNFAPFIGATLGLITAGPVSDWFAMKLTRRNGGIREPEMRLPTLIPYACCTLVGSLIVAIGYQRQWSWEVIVIIGYTLLGVQVSALPAISTTYAIDSYKPVAGEFLVSATVNKNLWGYGISKFLTPWILKDGYIPPQLTNMALCLFFISCAIPLYFYGKTVRRWSKNSFVHKRK
jgi:MFS family permease